MASLREIGYEFDYDDIHTFFHRRLPYDMLKPDHVLRHLLLSLPIRKVVLRFNLTESGLFCVLPWLTMAISANVGSFIMYSIMQSIGFLGPAFFLTQLSHINSPAMAVLCMACSQGTDALSQSGLYSNHQDIGPRYSGVLLGLSNTAGVLAGVLGTTTTGYILQHGPESICMC